MKGAVAAATTMRAQRGANEMRKTAKGEHRGRKGLARRGQAMTRSDSSPCSGTPSPTCPTQSPRTHGCRPKALSVHTSA